MFVDAYKNDHRYHLQTTIENETKQLKLVAIVNSSVHDFEE